VKRRAFISLLGGAAAWPLWTMLPYVARAAPPARSVTIGVIAPLIPAVEGLRKGFRELGYVEGQNLRLEYRWAEGPAERYVSVAEELLRLGVDVIVTYGTPATMGARQATTTLPIVAAALGDPLGARVVPNLARPGGNLTGFSTMAGELEVKRLQVLKELLPNLHRLGIVSNPTNPATAIAARAIQQAAARTGGLTIVTVEVRGNQVDQALVELREARPDAALVLADQVFLEHAKDVVAFISAQRWITMYAYREFVQLGGLLSYGTNYHELFRKAAGYVDRILNGADPGDLPIQQPDRFQLVINLKTAKGLNLEVPATVLALADEVIE